MGSIFLSYRREDAEGQAGRLYDDLVAVFGPDSVFMDVSAIEPGRDFRKAIDQSLNSCGVFLSLVGRSWLSAKDVSGQRRLDDPADFVHLETVAALGRDIPVIPVLVQGASMPKPDQLPDDLKDLAYRNAMELTHSRWDSDVQVLIRSLRPHILTPGRQPEPHLTRLSKANRGKLLALAAIVLLVIAGIAFYLRSGKKVAAPPAQESGQTTTPPAAVGSFAPEVAKHRTEKVAAPRPAPNQPFVRRDNFSLAAEQKPLADNPKRYTFTLSLKAPSATIDDVSRVHYDLVYGPNPLSLEGGSPPAFSAAYNGWGCYETVVVTVYFKSPGSQPQKKTFNMCDALN